MFGISRTLLSLLALSNSHPSHPRVTTALSSTTTTATSNGQRDPGQPPSGWETLLNTKICRLLEQQDLFHAHYAQLGNPSWKLDLQPSGACVLEFTSTVDGSNVAKYNCRLVGSESNTAGTFLWAIPPDPTLGVPHDLLPSLDELVTSDIQTSIFQTRQEIPMTSTINGYSIALVAGSLLEEPAKAVFLGPYGADAGTLYLLITDTETYPKIQDERSKLDRLKGFVSMAAEIPFLTNHRVAFAAFAHDLGLSVTTVKEDGDEVVVTVTDPADKDGPSLDAYFNQDDSMKRLGDLMLMTKDELEAAQQQQQQVPVPPGNPNNKCAQLQQNFFQKVMDEALGLSQRELFLVNAKALGLTLSADHGTAKEVEAWDKETMEVAIGVFDEDDRMTQWRNEKKK